ncbi:hypothetical protein VQW74_02145, partial [Helicobacter pylori]
MDLHLKKALFLASLSCLNANESFVDNSDFLAIMPSDKEEENTPQVKLEHKLEQKVAPQNTLKEQEVTPLKSAELLQSQVKREFKEKKKAQKHFKAMQTKNGFFLGSEIAITGTKLTQSLSLISNATDDLITYSHTSSNANFNMGV